MPILRIQGGLFRLSLGLYGYDYSEEMIRLAEMIRLGVRETYSAYLFFTISPIVKNSCND